MKEKYEWKNAWKHTCKIKDQLLLNGEPANNAAALLCQTITQPPAELHWHTALQISQDSGWEEEAASIIPCQNHQPLCESVLVHIYTTAAQNLRSCCLLQQVQFQGRFLTFIGAADVQRLPEDTGI